MPTVSLRGSQNYTFGRNSRCHLVWHPPSLAPRKASFHLCCNSALSAASEDNMPLRSKPPCTQIPFHMYSVNPYLFIPSFILPIHPSCRYPWNHSSFYRHRSSACLYLYVRVLKSQRRKQFAQSHHQPETDRRPAFSDSPTPSPTALQLLHTFQHQSPRFAWSATSGDRFVKWSLNWENTKLLPTNVNTTAVRMTETRSSLQSRHSQGTGGPWVATLHMAATARCGLHSVGSR